MIEYRFHEGTLPLPDGYEDRTANVFVAKGDAAAAPNLSISRDSLREGEAFTEYVSRQLDLLKEKIPGYALEGRAEATLGAGEGALVGEQLDARFKSNGKRLCQRQAAFPIAPGRVLVFSATFAGLFDDPFNRFWVEWLSRFEMNAHGAR